MKTHSMDKHVDSLQNQEKLQKPKAPVQTILLLLFMYC